MKADDLGKNGRMDKQTINPNNEENIYQTIIDYLGEGVVIIQDGVLGYSNKTAADLLGYSVEELINTPVVQHINSSHILTFLEVYREILEKRYWGRRTIDTLLKRKDGTDIPVQLVINYITFRGSPAVLVILRDIAERRGREDELSRKASLYASVFTEVSVGLIICDTSFAIVDINRYASELFGEEADRVVGTRLFNWIDESDYPKTVELVETLIRNGQISDFQVNMRGKDGTAFPVQLNSSAVKTESFDGFIFLIRKVEEVQEVSEAAVSERYEESENRYRTLLELCPDAIVVHNGEKILYANSVAAEIAGFKGPEELIGRPIMEFVPPHFREVMAEGIRIMMEKKIPSPPLELSFILPNGTEKIFDSRASYITYEGKPAVLAVLRDITERKKLEKALKESQKEFEALAENSIVGTFIVQDGVFKYVNPTLAAMGGYTREEVIGKNPAVFIHPDDVPMVMERMERRLRGEKVTSRYTARAVTKTGEVKVLEFFASRAMVSGKPAIIGIAVDVTETEKAKKALESSEKKFRSLFESAPDVIYILDSEGKVIDVNPSIAKLGYSKEEIVGKYMHEFCTPDCKEKYVTELQKIIETGQARYQVDVFSKNGRVFKFDCSCFAVYSPEKKIQYIIAIHRDVTEKYELSRDLKDAVETLKLLNRMLRHDILNNLNVILLALESVKVSGKDKLLIKHALNSLEKSVRLIDKARELEKMVVSGKELKPLRAIEVIEEVAKRHPEIEINITGDLVVLADEAFESVIDNLVLNSVVHGKATRVDIEMVEEGEYCVIKVKDNGRGIPDEIKERVFQEGFVAGESGHTGLGLYIVKQVIERYGGRVWIEDNFPRGAVIAMRLRRV